jgi:hypothetical protein
VSTLDFHKSSHSLSDVHLKRRNGTIHTDELIGCIIQLAHKLVGEFYIWTIHPHTKNETVSPHEVLLVTVEDQGNI